MRMIFPQSGIEHSGFTLVEMLVVILLIGLTLGLGLTLDFAGSPQRQEQQVRLFANELRIAAQEAVLDGAVWGLDFFVENAEADERTGYRWLRREEQAWIEQTLPGGDAAGTLFEAENRMELTLAGQVLQVEPRVELPVSGDESFSPEIWLLPTGEIDPFSLRLSGEETGDSIVAADMLGRVRVNEDALLSP